MRAESGFDPASDLFPDVLLFEFETEGLSGPDEAFILAPGEVSSDLFEDPDETSWDVVEEALSETRNMTQKIEQMASILDESAAELHEVMVELEALPGVPGGLVARLRAQLAVWEEELDVVPQLRLGRG